MSGLQSVSMTVCYTCVAVSVISVMIPQKRTRRVMGFVISIFIIGTVVTALMTQMENIDWTLPDAQDLEVPSYSEDDYTNAVAQLTADNVTSALNDLLCNEGIEPDDIRLTMKISEEGRISVVRAVIYMSEAYRDRISDVKSIVYRNLSKEPEIYVTGEEAQ